MTIIFDPEKHFLGKLCNSKHDWENSGLSLRHISNKKCVICSREQYHTHKERFAKYRKENADRIREWNQLYYQENADKIRERVRSYEKENAGTISERRRNHYQENVDKLREKNRNYYKENADKISKHRRENADKVREQQRNYRQTSKGKSASMRGEQKRRAIEKGCHSLPYKPEDILNLFNGECAYCGNKVKLSLDHFIPISKGGSDVQGNLLPACLLCNSKKHNSDAIDWYKKQPFFNQKRLKQILKILGKTESNYDQIPLF